MTGPAPGDTGATLRQAADGQLLEMREIRKTFGPVVALDGVDFSVAPREVHGLLGGNGAGKTTLMNVLYGLYRADSGQLLLDGREVTIRSPRDAIAAGVGMVHQNFLQVETYTVTENVVLGTPQPTLPTLDLRQAEQTLVELSQRFGLAVDPRAVVGELSVGIRQRVEILKALYRGARLLVLDEPTTNLTPQEVDALFASLRAIVDEGMSVVFITHKIRETLAACDRMTIMRDGRRVEVIDRADTDARHLAALMVGEEQAAAQAADVLGETLPGDQPQQPPARRRTDAHSSPRKTSWCTTSMGCLPCAASRSTCTPARSSGSPVSPATARSNSPRRWPACARCNAVTSRSVRSR